ncbi:MAG: hypothetical protein NVS3B12_24970 [Acidimicrobiales bacterium]
MRRLVPVRLLSRRRAPVGVRSLGTAGIVVALSLAGCSSSARPAPAARSTLEHDVDALRAAVGAGDRRSADAALTALDRDLDRLGGSGQVPPAAAARIRSAGDVVRKQLDTLPTTTTPSTSTTVTTSTTLPPQPAKGGKGDGGGEGD